MAGLRVLFVSSSSGWGGMEMHPLALAEALAREGVPLFFAARTATPVGRRAPGRAFALTTLPFGWYLDPRTYPALRRLVDAFRINVVHVHHPRDTWRSLLLAGILRRRAALVFTKHSGSPAGVRKADPLHRLLSRRLDAMVATSAYIRRNILGIYPIAPGKVRVIPYGLGSDVVGNPAGARRVRERLNVPEDGPLAGLVASFSPGKRQHLFVEAAERVLAEMPECRFVLAGALDDRGYAEGIRRRLDETGLRDRIRMPGFLEDIPDLMAALDVLVVPSEAEAFGLVTLEAMANGTPVVGSRSGAMPEIVEDGSTGLLFEPDGVDELADVLLRLLRSPDLRVEMGERGKRVFQERFSLAGEVRETLDLYRSLVGR